MVGEGGVGGSAYEVSAVGTAIEIQITFKCIIKPTVVMFGDSMKYDANVDMHELSNAW